MLASYTFLFSGRASSYGPLPVPDPEPVWLSPPAIVSSVIIAAFLLCVIGRALSLRRERRGAEHLRVVLAKRDAFKGE